MEDNNLVHYVERHDELLPVRSSRISYWLEFLIMQFIIYSFFVLYIQYPLIRIGKLKIPDDYV